MVETVLERIGTEGFEKKPSPAQSGRVSIAITVAALSAGLSITINGALAITTTAVPNG